MLEAGHQVSVLDEDPEAIARLERTEIGSWQQRGGRFTVGTALEIQTLEEAGLRAADAFVVATDGDNTNLVAAQIAQKHFGVEQVIVRVMDPERAAHYAEMGLRTVCPTQVAVDLLQNALQEVA